MPTPNSDAGMSDLDKQLAIEQLKEKNLQAENEKIERSLKVLQVEKELMALKLQDPTATTKETGQSLTLTSKENFKLIPGLADVTRHIQALDKMSKRLIANLEGAEDIVRTMNERADNNMAARIFQGEQIDPQVIVAQQYMRHPGPITADNAREVARQAMMREAVASGQANHIRALHQAYCLEDGGDIENELFNSGGNAFYNPAMPGHLNPDGNAELSKLKEALARVTSDAAQLATGGGVKKTGSPYRPISLGPRSIARIPAGGDNDQDQVIKVQLGTARGAGVMEVIHRPDGKQVVPTDDLEVYLNGSFTKIQEKFEALERDLKVLAGDAATKEQLEAVKKKITKVKTAAKRMFDYMEEDRNRLIEIFAQAKAKNNDRVVMPDYHRHHSKRSKPAVTAAGFHLDGSGSDSDE